MKLTWLYKPSSHCLVQAEGYYLGYWFYFRSRGVSATIIFSKVKEDYLSRNAQRYDTLWKGTWPSAGWLGHNKCKQLICKGLRRFKRQLNNR